MSSVDEKQEPQARGRSAVAAPPWDTHKDALASYLVVGIFGIIVFASAIRDGHITPQSASNLALVLLVPVLAILWVLTAVIAPLFVAWLADSQSASSPNETGFDYTATLRRITKPITPKRVRDVDPTFEPIHPQSSAVSTSADDVVRLILRDFVESWHTPLLQGSRSSFITIVEKTIRESVGVLVSRLLQVDVASMGVQKLLPKLTAHMTSFYEAEAKLHEGVREYVEDDDGDVFLAGLYNSGRLHPAVGSTASPDTRVTEIDHLRKLSTRILKGVMPPSEQGSRPVFIIVREILACSVLKGVIDSLCDPDTLNSLIDEKVGAALQEQRLVNRLREALDKEAGTASVSRPSASTTTTTPHSFFRGPLKRNVSSGGKGSQSFDNFLEQVSSYSSILEARRTRNDLMQQIRKTKADLLQSQEESDEMRRAASQAYLSRLEIALEALDRRLDQLSAKEDQQPGKSSSPQPPVVAPKDVSLQVVLTSPSAISHFLEFAEARRRSILVQFWLSVNSFKNPLEDVESGTEDEEEAATSFKDVKTLHEDVQLFTDQYYSSQLIAQCVKPAYIDVARAFVQTTANMPRATQAQIRKVRQSVVRAQRQVYVEMLEEDWPLFQKTPGWYKAIDDINRSAMQMTAVTTGPKVEAEDGSEDDANEAPRSLTSTRPSKGGISGGRTVSDPPMARRRSDHADLFGDEPRSPQVHSSSSRFETTSSSLFGSEDERGQASSTRSTAYSNDIEQLMGGKGGSTFDGLASRTPLFREALFEEEDEAGGEESGGDGDDLLEARDGFVRVDKMDAIESALANILHEDVAAANSVRPRPKAERSASTARELRPAFRRASPSGNQGQTSRQAIFDDDNENERSTEQLQQQQRTAPQQQQKSLHHLTSADLSARLGRVETRIQHLRGQESVLDALVRKAELTGSSEKEMRLLRKSQESVARELRELEFEQGSILDQQIEADDVKLDPASTRVTIQQATTKLDAEGKEYALYLIEVTNLTSDSDQMQNGWVVGRRYNDFFLLHTKLKEGYQEARALEPLFPGKRLVGLVHSHFVEARRMALEKYLAALVRSSKAICQSGELKAFLRQSNATITAEVLNVASSHYAPQLLSPTTAAAPLSAIGARSPGLVSSLFRSVTGVAEGFDDFLFGPSMLDIVLNRLSTSNLGDLVSLPDFERLAAVTTQQQPLSSISAHLSSAMAPSKVAAAAELKDVASSSRPHKVPPFTAPICDALIELFELKREDNWLRRLALVMVLQQALGGTIERLVSALPMLPPPALPH